MDYYEQLKNTVQSASQQTSGAPILGGAPELQKYYDINYQLPLSSAGIKTLAAQTDTEVANQEIARREAEAAAKSAKDPGNYKRIPKEDGGYTFLDGAGNEVSAAEYASAIGKSTADVLTDSQNPIDVQYQNDYNNLQDFITAASTGDKATLDAFYSENPSLKNQQPAQVIQQFKKAYPTVFGSRANNYFGGQPGQPMGSTFIPSSARVKDALAGGGVGE